jgi:hypothetical protein
MTTMMCRAGPGVTGVLGAGGHAAPVAGGTIRTTGFTLASNANGTDTLTLTGGQPVSITTWNVLRMSPAGFGYRIPGDAVLVINPAVLPGGTELWFGYRPDARTLFERVVDENSRTCRPFPGKQPPKAGSTGSAGNS